MFDFSFFIPNKLRDSRFNQRCKFQQEGEYRCIVDKLGEGKAFKNGYSTILR